MPPTPTPNKDSALKAIDDLTTALKAGLATRDIIRRISHHWPNCPHRSHGLLLQRLTRAKAANGTNTHSRHFLEPVQAMEQGGAYLLAVEGRTATVYLLVQSDEAIARNQDVKPTAIYRITRR